jgi:hypothetical protein
MVYSHGSNRENTRKPKDSTIRHQVNTPAPPELFTKNNVPQGVANDNSSIKRNQRNKGK